MAAGEAASDLKWLLIVLALLGVAWLATGGRYNPEATSGVFINPPAPLGDGAGYGPKFGTDGGSAGTTPDQGGGSETHSSSSGSRSSYSGDFYLSSGTARSTHLPNQEYITLRYNGETPVNITGWYLTNSRGAKNYVVGSHLVSGTTGVAVIPQAVKLFTAGLQAKTDLILERGGEVIITTGISPLDLAHPPAGGTGFQVNRCSGYWEDDRRTEFAPRLRNACPPPRDWPSVSGIDDNCYRFIETIRACHVPEFKTDSEGEKTVDGRTDDLSSVCRRFVQDNFNYDSCVATFASQPNFYQPEWRVFLGLRWELWSEDREKITLYDREHRMVTELEY